MQLTFHLLHALLLLLSLSLITASPSLISLRTPTIEQRDGARTTENGLVTDACKMVTLIFAKGTTEVGNVGSYVGPAFIRSLRALLGTGRLTVQGVDYSASIPGFVIAVMGGGSDGSEQMASLIETAAGRCPSTQIVLGGYSQGAGVVHSATSQLPNPIISRIIAVVLFGDPNYGQNIGPISASDARVDSICHDQDVICAQTGGTAAHFTYTEDAGAAAQFVLGQTGLLD